MKVVASAAISSDGYLDDTSIDRLVLSCSEDWAEVYALRAASDAILVGAQTVRADNPSLLIKDNAVREARTARGLSADILKVTISVSGNLDVNAKFFNAGDCKKIVFVGAHADRQSVEALKRVATVVSLTQITAAEVVGYLEKMGVEQLMVEGGGQILKMFLEQDAIDEFRLAVSPVVVADAGAPKLYGFEKYLSDRDTKLKQNRNYALGDMKIHLFERADTYYMKMAINQSRLCVPSHTSYCVGSVVVTACGEIFYGYTHETSSTNHAEEEAIAKAVLAGAKLSGAVIYASMEPCSTRSSKPKSCSALILEHGFSKVVFALYEPDLFVACVGARLLRDSGVDVKVLEEFSDEVRKINSHIIR